MASNITDNEGLIVYEVISDSTKTTAQLMAGASTAHTQLIEGALIDRVSDNEAKLDLLKPTDTVVFDTVNATTAITVPSLQLTGGIGPQGTMTWNNDEETVDLVQNGNTLPIGQTQEYHVRNATGSTITKGKVVMAIDTIGNSGRITAAPMDGTALANTKYVLGIAAENILAGEDGKVLSFGKVKGVNTLGALSFGGLETWTDANVLYIDTINSGGYLTNVRPTTGMVVPIAIVIHAHASGTLFSRTIPVNEDYYTTGEVDNLLNTKVDKETGKNLVEDIKVSDYDSHLVNIANPHSVTASQVGAYTKEEADAIHELQVTNSVGQSVSFFLGDTIVNGDNYDLTNFPDSDLEQVIVETAVAANTPYFIERYITQPLGGLKIDGGTWWFRTYGAVNNNVGISEIITRINRRTIKTGTITIAGTGLTRTVTATDGIFAPTDANTSILNSSLIETPTDTFWISSYISPTQVTVTLESDTYVNETNVPFYMYYKLFEVSTGEINGATPNLYEVSTTQPSFNILATDSILLAYFAVTTSINKTLSLYKGGAQHYSHVVTPLVYRHNALSGLNEGNYRHLSEVEKTYFDTIPTLLDNKVDKITGKQLSANDLTNELLTLLTTKKVKNVTTDALNDKLVITYTDDTTSELNINDIITDVHVSGASLDATTNVLTLTSTDGGADVTVNLSDFVNSSELTSALATKVTKVTSTDNAIVRFNGTTGEVQDSGVIIDDSGNVGIGTSSPSRKLETIGEISVMDASNTNQILFSPTVDSNRFYSRIKGSNANHPMSFWTGTTERMRIDSAGNVGIGAIPTSWNSTYKALDIGGGASFFAPTGVTAAMSSNAYVNASSQWIYKNTSSAGMYAIEANQHKFYVAAAGTAGNQISFANAMTITGGGYIKLGSDAPAIKTKKVTGTTAATEGGITTVSHGLDGAKIISATVMVRYSATGLVPPNYVSEAEYEFAYSLGTANTIILRNSATNSSAILNKPFVATFLYEE